jgi:arginyl-tRNA synthetase
MRALSVLRKTDLNLLEIYGRPPVPAQDLEPLEKELLGQLLAFAKVVEQAAQELAPHQVCTYLFELAQIYNRFYHQHQILQAGTQAKKELRLQLTAAAARVLTAGLDLLGIEILEEM